MSGLLTLDEFRRMNRAQRRAYCASHPFMARANGDDSSTVRLNWIVDPRLTRREAVKNAACRKDRRDARSARRRGQYRADFAFRQARIKTMLAELKRQRTPFAEDVR